MLLLKGKAIELVLSWMEIIGYLLTSKAAGSAKED